MRMRRVYLGLLLLAVAGVVGLIVAGAFREREPEYQGKKLSEWVILHDDGSRAQSPQSQEAGSAIRRIGTRALPYLLRPPAGKPNSTLYLTGYITD